jgi:hypothetical protein
MPQLLRMRIQITPGEQFIRRSLLHETLQYLEVRRHSVAVKQVRPTMRQQVSQGLRTVERTERALRRGHNAGKEQHTWAAARPILISVDGLDVYPALAFSGRLLSCLS